MSAFKKGDVVKVKVTTPTGPITKMRMDDDGSIFYLVEWTNSNGVVFERWFAEEEIELQG